MFKLGLAAIAGFILGLLLIGITAALADDKIVVINHAPKASPISAYVKAYQEGVPNSVYYQAKNCEDAKKIQPLGGLQSARVQRTVWRGYRSPQPRADTGHRIHLLRRFRRWHAHG